MSYDVLNRPLRIRPDAQYRLEWAKDLSRTPAGKDGIDWRKVELLQTLPLFEVLLEGGIEGVREAERIARLGMAA